MAIQPVLDHLRQIYEQFLPLRDGKVADYIPELTKADPEWFGVALMTRDGHLYEVGDTAQPFTIQSISKALAYGVALEDWGEAAVLSRIGVEPSGEAFNAISLSPQTGAPMNPMINAGAIAACGLVRGETAEAKTARVLGAISRYAGRQLDIDRAVYESESRTGHRNRAIGWMLRNFDILDAEPTPTLEAYFSQCSIRVTCRDLAAIGATLANNGINPITGERAVGPIYVGNILGVMTSCGMYDSSGAWIYQVGLPAKSGVGGGILAVLPGQFGIGVFSPRLDEQGNSVRGIAVCRELSRSMGLHMLNVSTPPASAIRSMFDRRSVASNRRRPAAQAEFLANAGERIRIYQLQGALTYGMIEPLIRDIAEKAVGADHFIVNLRSALFIDGAAARLLFQTRRALAQLGKRLIFSEAGPLRGPLGESGIFSDLFFPDDDRALEACEDTLLREAFPTFDRPEREIALADCVLCEDLDADDVAQLDKLLGERTYPEGTAVVKKGDAANELLILTKGSATVRVPKRGGEARVDAFSAGMHFGEVAFLDSSTRSADVIADSEITCRVLTRETFDNLASIDPALKIRLMHALTKGLTRTLRRLTTQLGALA